jgi:methionyl-tRNA formyltransferase
MEELGKKIRVVFCGEKPLALQCLKFLLSRPGVEIASVCTRRRSPVWWGEQVLLNFCEEEGLPIRRRDDLKNLEYDYLISVLYPFVIEETHIKRAKKLALNLHEAPLPRWRGCNGYTHAILSGDTHYGTILHRMDPKLDAGDLIAKETFPLHGNETAKELYTRTSRISYRLFRNWIPRVFLGEYSLTPMEGEASFINARHSLEELKSIPGEAALQEAYTLTRAMDFTPWEPAYYMACGRKYYFMIGGSEGRNPGQVTSAQPIDHKSRVCDLDFGDMGLFVIQGLPRPLLYCDEDTYQDFYPLFNKEKEKV